jgi:hypothetical protein
LYAVRAKGQVLAVFFDASNWKNDNRPCAGGFLCFFSAEFVKPKANLFLRGIPL